MTTFCAVLPDCDPTLSILSITSSPSFTLPNTTCFPSSHGVSTVQMKNCDPLATYHPEHYDEAEKSNGIRMLRKRSLVPVGWDTIIEQRMYVLFGPALAMDKIPFPTCVNVKFSSLNLLPYMLFPPVPLWFVKSPPWHINCGMTRWNDDPLNPNPGSPVHKARKFSAGFENEQRSSSNYTTLESFKFVHCFVWEWICKFPDDHSRLPRWRDTWQKLSN